ncbi:MAG: hypothetical protein SGCHY_003227 [Lobulomycetales sp.]
MQTVTDETAFNAALMDKANTFQVTVLNFTADWAEPCKQMDVVFATLASKTTAAQFFSISPDEFPDLAEHYGVECIPCFRVLVGTRVVEKVDVANAQMLTSAVESALSSESKDTSLKPSVDDQLVIHPDINERLTRLVNSHPMMIFIKGNPSHPRCKFSRQLLEILSKFDAGYGSFDILSDETVRQELKRFSDWPTFPQVYINGDFVGGLDVVKELAETGEFEDMIPGVEDLTSRLKRLTNTSRVVAFIKGTKTSPKCGFTRQLIQLLTEEKVTFETFDILEDEAVRQGLKEFSDWPTFPQLYVDGEFVGGLDIVKEMVAMGEPIC